MCAKTTKPFIIGMGSKGGYRGWAYRVSPDGKFEPVASGMRSPAGIGINPSGDIFYTDNQGDWVGTSKMHQIVEGDFYGHPVSLQDAGYSREKIKKMSLEEFDRMRTPPVVWIPHGDVANSPGNPIWDTSDGKFGPFAGQCFIGDQTRSSIFRVSLQKVDGIYQGMVIDFLTGFQSGNIRLQFAPDGSLWAGQTSRGWTARGGKLFGLQKVTWDGTAPFEILDVKMTKEGFRVSFTKEIKSDSISKDSLKIDSWWYNYNKTYGSPKDDVAEESMSKLVVSEDRKSLLIEMPLAEKRVYGLDFSALKSAGGKSLANEIAFYTFFKKLK